MRKVFELSDDFQHRLFMNNDRFSLTKGVAFCMEGSEKFQF